MARGWADVLDEGRAPGFILICLGVWLNAADSLVTSTIMPSVGRALGGFAWFGWASGLYLLASVLAAASAGLLARRFGLRRATAASALLYAAGCALSAGGGSMVVFLAGRGLQGVGGGWVAGLCSAAVGLMFPNRTLPRVYAAVTSIWGIASLIGPLIGGVFANAGEWRWAFWSFAIQGVAVAAAALVFLPAERGSSKARMAWPQLGLIGLGVGLIGAADFGGSPLAAAALVVLGALVLLSVPVLDRRQATRLLPRAAADLSGPVGAGFAYQFLYSAAGMSYGVYGPALLQTLAGLSPLAAGYTVAIESVGWTAAGLAVAGLTGAWPGWMIRAGAVLACAGMAMSAWAFPTGSVAAALAAGAVLGAGYGLSWAFTSQRVLTPLGEDERMMAAAGLNTVRLTGSAAGAAAAAVAANLCGVARTLSPEVARVAGVWVFAVLLPVALAGLFAGWRVGAGRAPEPSFA